MEGVYINTRTIKKYVYNFVVYDQGRLSPALLFVNAFMVLRNI